MFVVGASFCVGASLLLAASAAFSDERVVGLPCEGCHEAFRGMPGELTSAARIAPADEPGEPMILEGTVTRQNGEAAPGTIVYAYHTDINGTYPTDPAGSGHGRLRGWAVADEAGQYRFETIRPAGYPGTTIPAHVHVHVIEPGRCAYFIDDVLFDDDPRLSPAQREGLAGGRGGNGVTKPRRSAAGIWMVRRDIRLGEGISDYAECDQ